MTPSARKASALALEAPRREGRSDMTSGTVFSHEGLRNGTKRVQGFRASIQSADRLRHALFGTVAAILAGLLATACLTKPDGKGKAVEEPNVSQTYVVQRAVSMAELTGQARARLPRSQWDGAAWGKAETFTVGHFHERSSDHHPKVQGKLLYTDKGIYVIFKVDDRYVISKHTEYQDPVCRDSCVEFFVQPKPGKGYLNFEINCGGTLLLQYHERDKDGKDVCVPVPTEAAQGITIYHSTPETVVPEISEETTWYVEYFVPFSIFEHSVGPLGPVTGQAWRANFYKCADQSSHPHWGAWAPIGEELSFHQPRFFGTIRFAE